MAEMTDALDPKHPLDLTNCDREPIHIPGLVQPHGALLVLEEPGLIIRQASANTPATLGVSLDELLGTPLAHFLPAADLAVLHATLAQETLEASPNYLPPLSVGRAGVAFEASIHRSQGALILELENWPAPPALPERKLFGALKKMLCLSRSSESVAEFCQRTAEEVRTFIGFDRVMVYRFDPDLSGHVIAEAKRDDLESLLGLHYPASDIPRQARELFRLSKLRLIPDLNYAPVAIVPVLRTDTLQPLDMSYCVTRSVSPIHVEYLLNMGVQASMSISVVIDDQLWGLFACHHYSPRYVPHAARTACDFLAQTLSIFIAGREQAEDSAYAKILDENQRLLGRAIGTEREFGDAVQAISGDRIGGILADGAALVSHGAVYIKGRAPDEASVLALAEVLDTTVHDEIWSTDRLTETTPDAGALVPGVAGLIVARLSRGHPGFLIWFRNEVALTVKWAGDVTKTVNSGPLGERLTPRKSFALWQQDVRGRSQPWSRKEITAAENVRHAYHELYAGHTQALVILNAEVAKARDQAVQATQAKDNFLAALSHELRTPLNPALLIASEEAANRTLSDATRASFAAIRDNIELEARLIDDLLDLSRITHGKIALEFKAVDLHAALRQSLTILNSEFHQKSVALVLNFAPTQPVVTADLIRLLQIFWNVLKNAVKFTPVNGTVTIETRIDDSRRMAVTRVTDTGIGLQLHELSKIFEAFSQGDHAENNGGPRFGGLGLGLAISRSLLRAHAGDILVESPGPGNGSTFTIELPLASGVPETSAPLASHPDPSSKNSPEGRTALAQGGRNGAHILLVEDHAATRAGMAMILERRGFVVLQAGTVAEGLALATENEPALVICDIGLPDADGYTLMRAIRIVRPMLPVIALSGYGMALDHQRAREAGFAELLTKPINVQTLERALARVLGTAPLGP